MEKRIRAGLMSELRKFGLLLGFIFGGVFGILIPFIKHRDFHPILIILGSCLIVLALVAPKLLQPFYRAWMVIGEILGWINSRIILGILFFLVMLPIALIKKLSSGKNKTEQDSYRVPSEKRPPQSMERPY